MTYLSYSPNNRRLVPEDFRAAVLQPGQSMTLDFGIKRAGLLYMLLPGMTESQARSVRYLYASDERMFPSLEACFANESLVTGRFPAIVGATPFGFAYSFLPVRTSAGHDVWLLEEGLTPLRYFRLVNDSGESLRLEQLWLDYTAAPYAYDGGFACDDELVNESWAMGAYTVELCSQPSRFTQRPLKGRYSDYVIWDGVRCDKDIWGGDLRPASLTALYAFDKPEIVKNTLDILLQLQHEEGEERGIIPGSGSYGQLFYEWTMWSIVNLWEYVRHTNDRAYAIVNRDRLVAVKGWMERKMGDDGLIAGLNSWMYSIQAKGKISGLALAQKAAWDAMAELFRYLKDPLWDSCMARSAQTAKGIWQAFGSSDSPLLTMVPAGEKPRVHYALDGNLWAVLHDVADRERSLLILDEIERQFGTDKGSINVVPMFDEELDGAWWWDVLDKEAAVWRHNGNVWPYMGGYEVMARMHAGQVDKGLDVLKRMSRSHLEQGHKTYWEMMYSDGSLPFGNNGDLLSLTHAWGGTGSYALQAYVGGIRPAEAGFAKTIVQPQLGSLQWIQTKVPTPLGVITLEAEQTANGIRGVVEAPRGMKCEMADGLELKARG